IIADLGDLTFWLLRRGVEFQAERLAGGILERPYIRARRDCDRSGDALPISASEAEWIEIAVLEAALSLVEHRQRHGLVRLYCGNRLVEHGPGFLGRAEGPLLRKRSSRE